MRFLDAFFAVRPLVLIPAWSFFLLGAATHAPAGVPVLRLLLLSLILVATHLLNQVVDFENDRLNQKGFFLQQGVFQPRQYLVAAALLMSVALGVAWARQEGVLLLGIAALLGLAYNLPPVRLSHRPFLDLVANATGYGAVAFLLGQPVTAGRPLVAALVATTGAVGAVFLHTTLLDRDGDRRAAKITSGVRLGQRRTHALAILLSTTAVVGAVLAAMPLLMASCALLALLTWFADSRRISVWGTALFAVAASVAFWWFGVLVVLLVMASRVYYARRFQLRYPSF